MDAERDCTVCFVPTSLTGMKSTQQGRVGFKLHRSSLVPILHVRLLSINGQFDCNISNSK